MLSRAGEVASPKTGKLCLLPRRIDRLKRQQASAQGRLTYLVVPTWLHPSELEAAVYAPSKKRGAAMNDKGNGWVPLGDAALQVFASLTVHTTECSDPELAEEAP